MNDKIYLIKYKDNIIGTYLKYKLAELFIYSCFQNNFLEDDIKILIYRANSCLYLSSIDIKNTDIYKKLNKNCIILESELIVSLSSL